MPHHPVRKYISAQRAFGPTPNGGPLSEPAVAEKGVECGWGYKT